MECNIVRDLLPLYMDDLCSDETAKLLEEHLKECVNCRQMLESLKKELDLNVQKEDWERELLPLKKIHAKLRRKSGFIILWSLLAVFLLCATLLLTYGQISKQTISFEILYEMCRMQRIGEEFAKGNIEPLYEILDSGYELQDQESAVLRLVYKSDKEYDTDMMNVIHNKYEQFFGGKELKYAGIESIDYTENHIRGWENILCVSLKFLAGAEIEYYITLYKMPNDSFLLDDYFGTPYLFYEKNTVEKEIKTEPKEVEKYSTEDTLFACLSNKFYDYDLACTRHIVMLAGQRRLANDFSLDGKEAFSSLLYSWDDLKKSTQITKDALKQEWSQLEERGLELTDIIWNVKSYDKDMHLYRYDCELVFTNKETGAENVELLKAYRMGEVFIVLDF